ncbi:hypothetical protein J1N10_19805 [Carboxylicivirga sp. A043]|uniref:DUF5684 domain-containing protein n=1 Tax=Carboxylicivirga litoralis TaxID=2816963 RepID=UPI0021CB30D2|nr:DUF5684 domain-containing protein [Carboxylicivirga sp. A043]MCU4158228.1 hypothetical protein [Carboxylicivirga sp. A043]
MENVGLFGGLIYMAIFILMIVSMWKIFEKAGKPGWAALIPIYNTIVLIEIVGKPLWWIVWLLLPGINIIFAIWITNLLSLSFGKSTLFTLGLLIPPFTFICYPILGLGDAKYEGPAGQ